MRAAITNEVLVKISMEVCSDRWDRMNDFFGSNS